MQFRTDISLLARGKTWSRYHHHHVQAMSVAIAVSTIGAADMMGITEDTTGITVIMMVTRMLVGLGMLMGMGMEMVMDLTMEDVTDTEDTIDGLAEMVAVIGDDMVTRLLVPVPLQILQIRMFPRILSPMVLVRITGIIRKM